MERSAAPCIADGASCFVADSQFAEVWEDATPGSFVAHFQVTDADSGRNGRFDCFLQHDKFAISEQTRSEYHVVTTADLDRETRDLYELTIECIDRGEQRLTSQEQLQVRIADANDEQPTFEQVRYNVSMHEGNAIGASVTQVRANDDDIAENAVVTYHVAQEASAYFRVDNTSGAIVALKSLDRERDGDVIEFHVFATDAGRPRMTGTATVSVTLLDINDEAPVFEQTSYSFSVDENEAAGALVGQVYAHDADTAAFNSFEFSIETNEEFRISRRSGIISTARVFDRERTPVFRLLVLARDVSKPQLVSSATVTIQVGDVNDNDPVFEFPTTTNNTVQLPRDAPKNYAVTRVHATDLDLGDNGKVRYVIKDGDPQQFFLLGVEYGVLTTARDASELLLSYTGDVIQLTIVALDSSDEPRSNVAVLNIELVDAVAGNAGLVTPSTAFLTHSAVTIVVALVAVTTVIAMMIGLVALLVYRKSKKRKRREREGAYNCRTAAMRKWGPNGDVAADVHEM